MLNLQRSTLNLLSLSTIQRSSSLKGVHIPSRQHRPMSWFHHYNTRRWVPLPPHSGGQQQGQQTVTVARVTVARGRRESRTVKHGQKKGARID